MVAVGVSKLTLSRTYQQAHFVHTVNFVFVNKGREWKRSKKSLCLSDLCWRKARLRNKCRPGSWKTSEVELGGTRSH